MKKILSPYVLCITFFALFLAACTDKAEEMPAGVEAVFAPYYEALGGERVLGDPISEAFPLESEGLTGEAGPMFIPPDVAIFRITTPRD